LLVISTKSYYNARILEYKIRDHVEKLIWTTVLEFRIIIWTSRVKMDGTPVCS